MSSDFRDVFVMLSDAPEGQIDDGIRASLRQLVLMERVKSDDVLAILDVCAHTAGATDFVMAVLDGIWQAMLEEEGITREEAFKNAEARRLAFENPHMV